MNSDWIQTKHGMVKLNRRARSIISRNADRAIGAHARMEIVVHSLTRGIAVDRYIANRAAEMCAVLRDIDREIKSFLGDVRAAK